jgi:hypothetical protein
MTAAPPSDTSSRSAEGSPVVMPRRLIHSDNPQTRKSMAKFRHEQKPFNEKALTPVALFSAAFCASGDSIEKLLIFRK